MASYYHSTRRTRGRNSSGRRNSPQIELLGRLLLFPALIFYLELVLHIYMKMSLKFLPIMLIFSVAAGLLCSVLILPFKRKTNRTIAKTISVLLSLVFCIEMVAKQILQQYYPFSTLGLAAGNRLTDYMGAIVTTVVKDIPIILILFLPTILLFVFGRRVLSFKRFDIRVSGVALVLALAVHVLGLGIVHLPWKGDLTPKELYAVATNYDDQVEQLGLMNMLRLDVKHMIIPAKSTSGDDFSDIGNLGNNTEKTTEAPVLGTEEETKEPEPVIDTSPNVMNVDLAALAESTKNKDVAWLANFFNSVTPTNKNKYTGMFEGYNVIQIVMEGFSGYAIDPELTPTLYKLTHEGFVFNNFYTPLHFTSTSNGECQTLLGLYPRNGNPATMTRSGEVGMNAYFSLAQQLGRKGYNVLGYHGNYDMYGRLKSHTNLGYDWRQYQSGLELEMQEDGKKPLWPQRDSYVVEASVDDYINSDQPFHVYYLTISGHMPYSNNRVVKPYLDTVRALPYSETTQNYIATAMELDKSLEILLQKLEEAGKLDKTLIVATPDHVPYFNVDTLEELAGKKFGSSADLEYLHEENIDFDIYKSSLIMWTPSIEEPVVIDKVCGMVDILPTVSNLLGLEYDSRMLAGRDILSDSEGLVVFSSKCWKSDKGFYNRYDSEFIPAEGVTMTDEEMETYVKTMKKLVGYKLDSTHLIVENDFYDKVFGD